jgi:exodeoxyribonuclease-3
MFGARKKNVGWRIDYFLVDNDLINKVQDSIIMNEVMGSDHCPVGLDIKL